MTRASRRRPPRTPLFWSALLALWSAVPAIEWCSVSWAEVTDECIVSCAVAEGQSPIARGTCPADGSPCGPEPRASERAFCLHGPVGGSGVSPASVLDDIDAPLAALMVEEPPTSPPTTPAAAIAVDVDVGEQPARGERPPVRAPPSC